MQLLFYAVPLLVLDLITVKRYPAARESFASLLLPKMSLTNDSTTAVNSLGSFAIQWTRALPERAPTTAELIVHVLGGLVVFDLLFGLLHALLHAVPLLFHHIHGERGAERGQLAHFHSPLLSSSDPSSSRKSALRSI